MVKRNGKDGNSPTEMCLEVPKKKYMITGKKAAYNPYQAGRDASKLYASP